MPGSFAGIKNLTKSSNNNLPDKIEKLIQSLSNKEDRKLLINIYNKVTRINHSPGSPQKGDGTLKKCIDLFKQKNSPANPREVLTKLEESLRGQEEYHEYYIRDFLPALLREIIQSKELGKLPVFNKETEQSQGPKTRKEEIAGIISDAIKQGGKYENFQHFLLALKAEIAQSGKLNLTEKTEIEKIIMELIILDAVSKSSDKDHSSSTIQNQNGRRNNQTDRQGNANTPKLSIGSDSGVSSREPSEENLELPVSSRRSSVSSIPSAIKENIEEQNNTQETPLNVAEKKSGDNKILSNSDVTEEVFKKYSKVVEEMEKKQTSKPSNNNGSDSGVSSREPSEENLELPVSSRRSSVSSILSSAGENNDPQKEDTGNQMQPEQAAPEEPQVSSQCLTLGSREKESMDPNSQTTQMTGSQVKDSMQPEEKKDKKNTITTVQKLPVNEKKGEDISLKQPNNRNLHVALVTSCALSTIGCIVAGAMTSGLVGAGLLAMAAVFAIAAVAELHSNFLSSKLTSINVEPLIDDKELTACSRL